MTGRQKTIEKRSDEKHHKPINVGQCPTWWPPCRNRWRPLFNAAVWLMPITTMPCSNAAKTRNPLKCARVPHTGKPISLPLVGQRSSYNEDMCRRKAYCYLTSFFPIVDTCLSCEDTARQSCAMVRRWRIFGDVLRPVFQRTACSRFQTCILNAP